MNIRQERHRIVLFYFIGYLYYSDKSTLFCQARLLYANSRSSLNFFELILFLRIESYLSGGLNIQINDML